MCQLHEKYDKNDLRFCFIALFFTRNYQKLKLFCLAER